MKRILLSIVVLSAGISVNAQVVNGDLETWAAGEPSNWELDYGGQIGMDAGTNNWVTLFGEGDPATTTELTGAAAAGGTGSSALLETKDMVGASIIGFGVTQYEGMLYGSWAYAGNATEVNFDFMAEPAANDTCFIQVTMFDADSVVVGYGGALFLSTAPVTTWTAATLPITYIETTPVARVEIWAESSINVPVTGSKLALDNFVLSGGSFAGIDEELNFEANVYPNPVSTVLNVNTTGVATSVSILSLDGKVISSTDMNGTSVSVNVANLTAGVYFYEIVAEDGSLVRNTFVKK